MEFNGQYLTYIEYTGLDGTLEEMPFNLLEFEARRQIDIRTFNRLKDLEHEDIPQEVKLCVFNMISSINSYTTSLTNVGNVASESTDGYSVSYLTTSDISNVVKSKENELDDIIRTYLLGVVIDGEHLMYCGVE